MRLDKSAMRRSLEQAYDFMVALASNPITQQTQRHVDFEINETLAAISDNQKKALVEYLKTL